MSPPDIPQARSLARAAFWLATLAILTATHWPGLSVEGPVDRTDLVVHVGVFAVWSTLLGLAYRPGLRVHLPVALAFAVFDETTQPLFNRTFDWLDLAADALGVLIGTGLAAVVHSRRARPTTRAPRA